MSGGQYVQHMIQRACKLADRIPVAVADGRWGDVLEDALELARAAHIASDDALFQQLQAARRVIEAFRQPVAPGLSPATDAHNATLAGTRDASEA